MFIYGGFENLGIEYLSAVLKEHGFQTELAFDPQLFDDPFLRVKYLNKVFNYDRWIINRIRKFKPQIVAFSVVSANYAWALNLARQTRLFSTAHITFGGIHPTSVPDKVIKQECIDSVVVGEGEFAFLDLANGIKSGKVDYSTRNVWFKTDGQVIKNPVRPYIDDLDVLPFPDKDLYYREIPAYRSGYTIITRRGCINSCSYCYNSVMDKVYSSEPKRIRLRSVDNVLEELKQAKRKYNFRLLRINDDLFTYNKNWLKEFSRRYKKEIGVPLYCFGSPNSVDEEVAVYLKEAGCYQLCLGVQSITPQVRKDVFHRSESNEQIIEAINLCRHYNIRVVVDNIIGYPGEERGELLKMAEFYTRCKPHRICIFWLVYYPRTSIVEIAERNGILQKEDIERLEEEPHNTANTLYNNIHAKQKKKYHLLLVLYHLLPAKLFDWILSKKIFLFFPPINPALIEYPYTIFARDRLDIPRRRYYIRYLKYMPKILYGKLINMKISGNQDE